ncbi:hypothetical protein FCV25MIE_34834 [Fagus crenata]
MSPIYLLRVAIQRTTTITTFFAVRSTIPRKLATTNSRTRLQAPVHSTGTYAMVLTRDPELRPVTLTRAALPVMTSTLVFAARDWRVIVTVSGSMYVASAGVKFVLGTTGGSDLGVLGDFLFWEMLGVGEV